MFGKAPRFRFLFRKMYYYYSLLSIPSDSFRLLFIATSVLGILNWWLSLMQLCAFIVSIFIRASQMFASSAGSSYLTHLCFNLNCQEPTTDVGGSVWWWIFSLVCLLSIWLLFDDGVRVRFVSLATLFGLKNTASYPVEPLLVSLSQLLSQPFPRFTAASASHYVIHYTPTLYFETFVHVPFLDIALANIQRET